jgi:hypothetical protein
LGVAEFGILEDEYLGAAEFGILEDGTASLAVVATHTLASVQLVELNILEQVAQLESPTQCFFLVHRESNL